MKILFLNLGQVNNISGGLEKVFIELADTFSSFGHDVILTYFDGAPGHPFFVKDKSNCRLVNLYQKTTIWNSPLFLKYRSFFSSNSLERKKFRRIPYPKKQEIFQKFILKENPDIVLLFQPEGIYCLPKNYKENKKVILTLHGSATHFINSYLRSIMRESFNSVSVIVPLLPHYTQELRLEYPTKTPFECIPNFIDIPPILGTQQRNNVITYVARISPRKRHELLIQAFALIASEFPSWKVHLWGDLNYAPRYTQKLKGLIKSFNLEKQIVFCGVSNNIAIELQKASFSVFPSESEGLSLSLIEAFASGLPVIGFCNAPGVNSLIQDQYNGILVQEDVVAMAEAVKELIQDSKKRDVLSRQAIETAKNYSRDKVILQWEELLNSL